MAMQESNSSDESQQPGSNSGFVALPHEWGPVASLTCPVCRHDLEPFLHAGRYTCFDCGFYIAVKQYEIIKQTTTKQKYAGPGISRGYGFGLTQFKNETPF